VSNLENGGLKHSVFCNPFSETNKDTCVVFPRPWLSASIFWTMWGSGLVSKKGWQKTECSSSHSFCQKTECLSPQSKVVNAIVIMHLDVCVCVCVTNADTRVVQIWWFKICPLFESCLSPSPGLILSVIVHRFHLFDGSTQTFSYRLTLDLELSSFTIILDVEICRETDFSSVSEFFDKRWSGCFVIFSCQHNTEMKTASLTCTQIP